MASTTTTRCDFCGKDITNDPRLSSHHLEIRYRNKDIGVTPLFWRLLKPDAYDFRIMAGTGSYDTCEDCERAILGRTLNAYTDDAWVRRRTQKETDRIRMEDERSRKKKDSRSDDLAEGE